MNPYEIRLQILLTAKEMLMEKYRYTVSSVHESSRHNVEIPSSEQIIQLANELYVFVNTKCPKE